MLQISLLWIHCLGICINGLWIHCLGFSSKEEASFNFMVAVTICSDFGVQENKVSHCFHCFPIYLQWSYGKLVLHPALHFTWCTLHICYISRVTVYSLTKRGPLEKGMANHFSILALRTPWTMWFSLADMKHKWMSLSLNYNSLNLTVVSELMLCNPHRYSSHGIQRNLYLKI